MNLLTTQPKNMKFRSISIGVLEANPLAAEMFKSVLFKHDVRKVEHHQSLAELKVSVKQGTFSARVMIVDLGSFPQADHKFIYELREVAGARIVMVHDKMAVYDLCNFIYTGIHGFLTYSAVPRRLVAAVLAVAQGELWFEPSVLHSYIDFVANLNTRKPKAQPGLTGREAQIIAMLEDGLSNKEISVRLRISESTVKFHIGKIFSKLDVHDRRSVMKIAFARERQNSSNLAVIPEVGIPAKSKVESFILSAAQKRAG